MVFENSLAEIKKIPAYTEEYNAAVASFQKAFPSWELRVAPVYRKVPSIYRSSNGHTWEWQYNRVSAKSKLTKQIVKA